MASQSLPVPAQAHKQSRPRKQFLALPLRAAFIAFIVIVILFRWLHLIVSLQVASTDQQIQISTDQLAKYERGNAALLFSIAETTSPHTLAQRARELGYSPQTPIYVACDEPIAPPGEGFFVPASAEEALADLVKRTAAQPGSQHESEQVEASP